MNKKGYTLVELIITLAVIGIMVVPIFNAFIEANRVNLQSRRQISAAYLAQNELETLKGKTRSSFSALDIDTTDGIDIDNSTWTYNKTEAKINGNTTFDVKTEISNITDDLGITIDSQTIESQDTIRASHCKVVFKDDISNVVVESNAPSSFSYTDDDNEVYLLFESINDNQSRISAVAPDLSSISGMPVQTIDTSNPEFNGMIVINIDGYAGMTDEWSINIINRSSWTVDAKPYDDPDNHIKMVSDDRSLNNVYIGSAFPVSTGSPSTVREYYRVIITVSYKGTVFEVIESTIGK